jgi:hypothetical protein
MDFLPEFAPDAKSQWHALDPILQELVWDEMERLVHSPPAPPKREFYHDVIHDDRDARHYIFLNIQVDRVHGKITCAGVIHHVRKK